MICEDCANAKKVLAFLKPLTYDDQMLNYVWVCEHYGHSHIGAGKCSYYQSDRMKTLADLEEIHENLKKFSSILNDCGGSCSLSYEMTLNKIMDIIHVVESVESSHDRRGK